MECGHTRVSKYSKKKVELCRDYGIEIKESDWPSAHFPKIFLADKGEFIRFNSDNLVDNFHIPVENTASYRADMKGTVEKVLHLIPRFIRHFVPGYIEVC